jgi:hypothetical protein
MELGSEIHVCSFVSTINLLLNPGIPLKGVACLYDESPGRLLEDDARVGCKASPAGLFIPFRVNGFPVNSGAVVVIVYCTVSAAGGVLCKVGSSFFGGPDIG